MYKKILLVNNNLEVIKVKNWINKISKEKLQRYLFVGVLILVFVAFFISLSLVKPKKDDPKPIDQDPPVEDPIEEVYETFLMPVDNNLLVVRKFYEVEAEKAERVLALHKMGTRYCTSSGISWALENGEKFDVYASLSGTVKAIKEDNLYGTIVVIEHVNNLETHYLSLSDVLVTEGQKIQQGTKIGLSSVNTYDSLQNHVHFRVFKNNTKLNPLNVIGKKTNAIE